jgi:putative transposase
MTNCALISVPAALPLPRTRAERRREERDRRTRIPTADELREVVQQDGLLAMACEVALPTLYSLMEQDADRQCGIEQKGKHSRTRTGYRNGYERGSIVLAGRHVEVRRPRVVGVEGGELPIASYQTARNPEFLSQAALTACVQGVSQRKHRRVLDALAPIGLPDASGLSKSAVGRRFIAAADERVNNLLARRLDERFLAVWTDCIQEAGYAVVCAVGVTETGDKKVLGLRQGTTENTILCRELFESLVSRGFSSEQGVVFIVDGGKGLSRALREVFGNGVLVQRCRVHKKRNVMEKLTLTGDERDAVERRIDNLWLHPNACVGQAHLELLARNLESLGQTAAAGSLREGAREMFTCTRLGVPDELWVSLTNTNVVESGFSQVANVSARVKRWRNGQQVLRWVGVGALEAEKSFTKTGSERLLQQLDTVLQLATAAKNCIPPPQMGQQAA